ncbi:hypothetical protein H4I96_10909 [Botrytis cinerea]
MDFAPYQASPEETRALSPPPRTSTSSPRQSISPIRRSFSPGVRSPAFLQSTSNAAAKKWKFCSKYHSESMGAERTRERWILSDGEYWKWVSRLAICFTVYGHVCRTFDVLLEPVYVMVIAPRRHQFDSMANQESISRW